MIEWLQSELREYYIYIKFIHLLFVMIWAWSTSVAYVFYVRIAWNEWKKDPTNQVLLDRRDWVYEQFDRGAVLEHIAFPIILITGPLLWVLGNWGLDNNWLYYKLLIVIFLFIPIEIFDYWIAHFGGNKERLRNKGEEEKREKMMLIHDKFLVYISPVIVTSVLSVLFLAIVKPF
jgi:hypothetical protein